ncbi:PREDICTED: tubulin monoglycylase TTLL3-like, partial [Nestor notabilis]|uniref:tubulin monoglycylase TTLL3-like n=1 Tax=Nestor notabilis TaxID=176057 RepID=UPI000523594C
MGPVAQPGLSLAAPASTEQQHTVNMELWKRAREHVAEAVKKKKIFSIQGPYPVIRKLLRARGWVEKKFSSTVRALVEIPEPLEEEEEEEQEEVQWYAEDPDGIHNMMSSMVRDQIPTFIWTSRCSAVDYRRLQDHQVVNHFTGIGAFITKEGLCTNLQNLPWFHQVDPTTFFPRCYRLGPAPPSPPELLETALQLCRMQLDSLEHNDIDWASPVLRVTDAEWDCFLQEYYRVVQKQTRLAPSGLQHEQGRGKLQAPLPQLHMEGIQNLWIIKPGAKSRGRGEAKGKRGFGHRLPGQEWSHWHHVSPLTGITCSARLEKVLELTEKCTAPSVQPGQWVVQKYVERPLLILGTKFDLRQWFLVTDWNPLTVWFYGDSYVRFCSRPFSLHCLHRSRHLCNVSIQKHWRLSRGRHPKLPPDLIWSSHQFQIYLQRAGHAEAWEKVMVPGMKEAVVAALCSAQEL